MRSHEFSHLPSQGMAARIAGCSRRLSVGRSWRCSRERRNRPVRRSLRSYRRLSARRLTTFDRLSFSSRPIGGRERLVEWGERETSHGPTQSKVRPAVESDDHRPDILRDGSGTGILFDARGYVLTCCHVVDSADTVFVRLADGRRIESVKVLTDPLTDFAVVQIADTEPFQCGHVGRFRRASSR